jgi:hypothetical protein
MRWLNFRSGITCLALLAVTSLPLVSNARSLTASIRIVNNSSRTIRNVYLSHVNADDWGNNQLGGSSIGAGESFTISNVTWDQQQVKVIAEDQDGCFLSGVVAVADNSSWTITNETSADCGSGSSGSSGDLLR